MGGRSVPRTVKKSNAEVPRQADCKEKMSSTSSLANLACRVEEWIEDLSLSCPPSGVSDADFNDVALELFRRQSESNPALAQLLRFWRVESSALTAWNEIPCVPTAAFKEMDMTTLEAGDRTRVFFSSGTTQQERGRHFHHAQSIALYERSLKQWLRQHCWPAGGREAMTCVSLTPPPSCVPHSSLVHMIEVGAGTASPSELRFCGELGPDDGWRLNEGLLRSQIEAAVEKEGPVCLFGTAFNFVQLLDTLSAWGETWSLPGKSRIMETGGYKGRTRELRKTELYEQMEDRLGIEREWMISEYGMSELSSQAYDGVVGSADPDLDQRVFHFPEWVRVRVVSPETLEEVGVGETGLLQVFDLANIWSALAIQTEDLAVRCPQGFSLKGRASFAEPKGCSLLPEA